tara:strand:+ start:1289 stop:1465 length:177 start_codon:yes stop_codon:yes gene_type:complete
MPIFQRLWYSLLTLIVVYGLGCAFTWETNPGDWHWFIRGAATIITIRVIFVFGTLIDD